MKKEKLIKKIFKIFTLTLIAEGFVLAIISLNRLSFYKSFGQTLYLEQALIAGLHCLIYMLFSYLPMWLYKKCEE